MRFVLIDESNGATTSSGQAMTPAVLTQIAQAAEVYLNRDVAAEWGGNYRVRAGAGASDVQPGEIVFALLRDLPGAPGAIAYHDVNGQGVPVAFDGITLSGTLLGPGGVSAAITHELAETAGDAACNLWADGGDGSEYAHELCDAVESGDYDILGVRCSNFVLRAFFDPGSVGPYDYMTRAGLGGNGPAKPFGTASGGYQILRNAGANSHQIWGAIRPERFAKKAHWSSRTFRRGARVAS